VRARNVLMMFCLAILAPVIAHGEEEWESWPMANKFAVQVDAFFPSLDTKVRVDASDTSPGTTIDFEQNLSMSDTETLPGITGSWRFAKRHQLTLNYFRLDRSGSSIVITDIKFGDEVFSADLPISSFFDMTVFTLNYGYSLIMDERKELTISLGLSAQDFRYGLFDNLGLGLEANTGFAAPVPVIQLSGGYAFTDKWVGRIAAGAFSFDLDVSDEKNLTGEVFTAFASIEHHTFEHVYFGLAYNYFDVGVDYTKKGLINSLGYQYRGPMLTVTAAF
jgi:hypothetical protein